MSTQLAMKAADAALEVILGLSKVVAELVDAPGAARMLGVEEEEFDAWMAGGSDQRVRWCANTANLPFRVQQLATYAWAGTWPHTSGDLDDTLTEALVVMPLLAGGASLLVDAVGNGVIPAESAELLETVLNAATGRRSLDSDGYGALTVPMLAALAGVSEKTIRMAANPRNERALRITKEGAATFIAPADAREWLERRADFQPTEYSTTGDRPLHITNLTTLAPRCREWRDSLRIEIETLAEKLGWNAAQVATYRGVEAGGLTDAPMAFAPRDLLAYAAFMGLREPSLFASQAYRALAVAHADAVLAAQLGEEVR